MRISDWSSDVCSSDPPQRRRPHVFAVELQPAVRPRPFQRRCDRGAWQAGARLEPFQRESLHQPQRVEHVFERAARRLDALVAADCLRGAGNGQERGRSEEHTSELQSLMRISYAVFCLKKKITHSTTPQSNATTLHYIHNTQHLITSDPKHT